MSAPEPVAQDAPVLPAAQDDNISPDATSPPRNNRKGPGGFSIDSLLFGVMERNGLQAPEDGQPETSAASEPVNVPEPPGLEYIRVETPEPIVTPEKPAEQLSVDSNKTSSPIPQIQQTPAATIPETLANVEAPAVVQTEPLIDQEEKAVKEEKKELQQPEPVKMSEQEPPKLLEKAQEPIQTYVLQEPAQPILDLDKKAVPPPQPVFNPPSATSKELSPQTLEQAPKIPSPSDVPKLEEKTTTAPGSQMPKGSPTASAEQCLTTAPNALPAQPQVQPNAQHFEKPQDIKKSPPIATTPTASRINDDALFKTPSPVDRKARIQRVRSLPKADLPPPTPPPSEIEVPKEEPKPVRVAPKNSLANVDVNLIFLALTTEDPVQTCKSEKSLSELVLAKKLELEQLEQLKKLEQMEQSKKLEQTEQPTDSKSANTGEDSRYAAADLKKLNKEVNEALKEEVAATELLDPAAIAKAVKKMAHEGSKRGRKKNSSKKASASSDTDTDTFSTGDIEEEEYEELIKGDPDGAIARSRNTPSSSASSRASISRKRKLQEPSSSGIDPKARRSARIKDRADSFYKSAVAALLEPDDEDEEMEEFEEVPEPQPEPPKPSGGAKRGRKPLPKDNTAVSKNFKRFIEEPSPHEHLAQKKTRAAARAEYYERRNQDDPLVMKMLEEVLTPKPARDIDILDHFIYPVVRRAIVNKNTLCYAISMLQLMLRVPQIYSIVRCHQHADGIRNNECFLCLLGDIISARPCVDEYSTFVALMKTTWKGVEVDMMHCVMEAMQKFFNRFDDDYLKEFPEFAEKIKGGFSPVRSIFEIQLLNEYHCVNCHHVTKNPDKAIYLSIDLTKKSDGTMQSLVDNIHKPTNMFGMFCPSCDRTEFSCTTLFHKLPEVLLYFVPRVRTKKREKDMTVVQIQEELVLRDSEKEHKYALCSFITHCGLSNNKGHYKQYEVDRSNGLQINEFDDARVFLNARLSRDITVVLAMFRKEDAVAKDAQTDVIFDGRGNITYSHLRHGRMSC